MVIDSNFRLEITPDGNVALEFGNGGAVLLLTPTKARRLATRLRTVLYGDALPELLAERKRLGEAIAFQRRHRA